MKVNFVDLKAQYRGIKEDVDAAIQAVIDDTAFAGGPFVQEFEENFAKTQEAKYCAAVNSGTSALHIAMMALGIGSGDEVIVPANTFFATAEAVSLAGATPVFVDCDPLYYNMDPAKIKNVITDKTKAVVPVHLYGQPAPIEVIMDVAQENDLLVIEDCAQSHLAKYKGRSTGTFGRVGCFSFYPGKNLGAYGEGGAVITSDDAIYKRIKVLRDHGSSQKYHHDMIGHNYRMDGIQGAVLNAKLRHLAEWTDARRRNADLYREKLAGVKEIILPQEAPYAKHVYHVFVVRAKRRDELMDFLKQNEIFTGIHYPIPCHKQNAYKSLGYQDGTIPNSEKFADEVVSLPMFAELKPEEIDYVAEKIKEFYHA